MRAKEFAVVSRCAAAMKREGLGAIREIHRTNSIAIVILLALLALFENSWDEREGLCGLSPAPTS